MLTAAIFIAAVAIINGHARVKGRGICYAMCIIGSECFYLFTPPVHFVQSVLKFVFYHANCKGFVNFIFY